jgi:hypothetical protein
VQRLLEGRVSVGDEPLGAGGGGREDVGAVEEDLVDVQLRRHVEPRMSARRRTTTASKWSSTGTVSHMRGQA